MFLNLYHSFLHQRGDTAGLFLQNVTGAWLFSCTVAGAMARLEDTARIKASTTLPTLHTTYKSALGLQTNHAPLAPSFPFFFLSFFLPFLFLFCNPDMPVLHTSAYLTKNASRSSGSTTVDILSFLSLCLLLLPLVARTRMGRVVGGWRSASGSEAVGSAVGVLYETNR